MSWNPTGGQPTGYQPTGWQPEGIDVTVSLTGLEVTSSLGAIEGDHALPLDGLSANVQEGSFVMGASGWQPTGWQPDGWQPTGWQPEGGVNVTLSLSGLEVASSAGSLSLENARALVGSALTLSQGIITTGNDISIEITGQEISAAIGSLTPEHRSVLIGSQASIAAGVMAMTRALTLLGIPFTISTGDVTAIEGINVTVYLTGISISSEQASVVPELAAVLDGLGLAADGGSTYAVIPPTGGSPWPVPSDIGTLASPNPWLYTVTDEAPVGIAGENGCIMGRFAWLAPNGTVTNARLSSDDRLCFVLTHVSGYWSVYWSDGRAVLRPGCRVSMMSYGDFWARFEYGAVQGAQVYADKATGKPISGYSAAGEATPWWVVTNAAPGELAIISTTSRIQ